MENFSNEIWRDILNYEGLYQASNFGRIRSLLRKTTKGKILSQGKGVCGYFQVGLCKNGFMKTHRVNRLVWEAFNGPIPEGMEVNHINCVKTDNRLSNLNLMTSKENCNWGTRNEKLSKIMVNRKDQSKTVLQFDLNGNFIKEWPSTNEIERQLNFDQGNIVKCLNNRPHYKTAYGYIWKYKEAVN